MTAARATPALKTWQTLLLCVTIFPLMANTAEIFATKKYGWQNDIITSDMVLAGAMLGAFLIMTTRIIIDWRTAALDQRLHGPMAIMILASAGMGGYSIYAIATRTHTEPYATFFFLGVSLACLVLMAMAPQKPKS